MDPEDIAEGAALGAGCLWIVCSFVLPVVLVVALLKFIFG